MKIKRSSFLPILSLLISGLMSLTPAQAQPGVYYETVEPGAFFICAWETVRVHEYPNLGSPNVGSIVYTEEVRHNGREAFVRSENRNYLYVETEDGTQGWVNEAFLVQGGGAVVILDNAAIFSKPNTNTSITNQQFTGGDIVVLSEFRDGWVRLTGKKKEKEGWVQGYDKLSAEHFDIEAATLLASALAIQNSDDRMRELRELRGGRSYLSPEMQIVIDRSIASASAPAPTYNNQNTQPYNGPVYYDDPTTSQPAQQQQPSTPYYATGEDAFSNNSGTNPTRSQNNQNTSSPVMRPTTAAPVNPYAYQEREVVDMASGQAYIRVRETGSIQPVKAKKPGTEFYAYHKSLPIGSKVLMAVPGTQMFIELEVIARLRSDNPHMIGLGGETIKAVFGEIAAKDVGSVSIEYPKP